jgi:ABC-type multidrug transport system permease subunit
MGILIGCIFPDLEVALNVTPKIFFPMMLFSGFIVNTDSIAVFVRWIEYISPVRYTLEALFYAEYKDTEYSPNPINSYGFDYGYGESLLYLAIIAMVVRILGFVALAISAKKA